MLDGIGQNLPVVVNQFKKCTSQSVNFIQNSLSAKVGIVFALVIGAIAYYFRPSQKKDPTQRDQEIPVANVVTITTPRPSAPRPSAPRPSAPAPAPRTPAPRTPAPRTPAPAPRPTAANVSELGSTAQQIFLNPFQGPGLSRNHLSQNLKFSDRPPVLEFNINEEVLKTAEIELGLPKGGVRYCPLNERVERNKGDPDVVEIMNELANAKLEGSRPLDYTYARFVETVILVEVLNAQTRRDSVGGQSYRQVDILPVIRPRSYEQDSMVYQKLCWSYQMAKAAGQKAQHIGVKGVYCDGETNQKFSYYNQPKGNSEMKKWTITDVTDSIRDVAYTHGGLEAVRKLAVSTLDLYLVLLGPKVQRDSEFELPPAYPFAVRRYSRDDADKWNKEAKEAKKPSEAFKSNEDYQLYEAYFNRAICGYGRPQYKGVGAGTIATRSTVSANLHYKPESVAYVSETVWTVHKFSLRFILSEGDAPSEAEEARIINDVIANMGFRTNTQDEKK